ncbi:MAG: TIGR03619 family F420-dependent LLM class oxidoreductase [Pseudomonadota bacterium]
MRLGLVLRNMGQTATAQGLGQLAEAAEAAKLDSIWVTDHVAIPPDDAEGSDGIYYDPLATLAYLAARTRTIHLGTAVLIAPYRPALPTAKWVATIQSLSEGRLELGIGVGWMRSEFTALGVDRHRRGQLTDELLAFLHRCFAEDVVVANDQPFLFRPCPPRPPILIGGSAPHALKRTAAFAEAWLPIRATPASIASEREHLAAFAAEAGRLTPEIHPMGPIPLDGNAGRDHIAAFAAAGASRLIHTARYDSLTEGLKVIEQLAHLRADTPS